VSFSPPADNRLREPLAEVFARVPLAWRSVTHAFHQSPAGQDLVRFVDARVDAGATVYPGAVFRALDLTAPGDARIVILGQDPYHGPGQAQGLAFSIPTGHKLAPSLRNLLQEVAADTGAPAQCGSDLSPWAAQGVLLLNSVLTVEDGQAHSHAGRGWELLTDALLSHLADRPEPMVFLLWGAAAQRKQALIDTARHRVLTANHPSPLSARRPPRPFIGCRHFSQANTLLAELRPGSQPVRW
jgi:uracil-DNA glycosylase